MISMTEAQKSAYMSDSAHKQIRLIFPQYKGGLTITNENIDAETMDINRSIMDGDELEVVGCISTAFSITIHDVERSDDLVGQLLFCDINAGDTGWVRFFNGNVSSVEKGANRTIHTIKAYDALHDAMNVDMTEFYNNHLACTLDELIKEVLPPWDYADFNLPNGNTIVPMGTVHKVESISKTDLLKSICQIAGCFGYITGDNKFNIYVVSQQDDHNTARVPAYKSLDYETYETVSITDVVIKESESDEGMSLNQKAVVEMLWESVPEAQTFSTLDEYKAYYASNLTPYSALISDSDKYSSLATKDRYVFDVTEADGTYTVTPVGVTWDWTIRKAIRQVIKATGMMIDYETAEVRKLISDTEKALLAKGWFARIGGVVVMPAEDWIINRQFVDDCMKIMCGLGLYPKEPTKDMAIYEKRWYELGNTISIKDMLKVNAKVIGISDALQAKMQPLLDYLLEREPELCESSNVYAVMTANNDKYYQANKTAEICVVDCRKGQKIWFERRRLRGTGTATNYVSIKVIPEAHIYRLKIDSNGVVDTYEDFELIRNSNYTLIYETIPNDYPLYDTMFEEKKPIKGFEKQEDRKIPQNVSDTVASVYGNNWNSYLYHYININDIKEIGYRPITIDDPDDYFMWDFYFGSKVFSTMTYESILYIVRWYKEYWDPYFPGMFDNINTVEGIAQYLWDNFLEEHQTGTFIISCYPTLTKVAGESKLTYKPNFLLYHWADTNYDLASDGGHICLSERRYSPVNGKTRWLVYCRIQSKSAPYDSSSYAMNGYRYFNFYNDKPTSSSIMPSASTNSFTFYMGDAKTYVFATNMNIGLPTRDFPSTVTTQTTELVTEESQRGLLKDISLLKLGKGESQEEVWTGSIEDVQHNVYTVLGNIFWYDQPDRMTMLYNLYNEIAYLADFSYRPFEASFPAMPWLECGDQIILTDKIDGEMLFRAFTMHIHGIGSIFCDASADGNQYQNTFTTSLGISLLDDTRAIAEEALEKANAASEQVVIIERDYATRAWTAEELAKAIEAINQFNIKILDSLPTTGESGTLYFIKKTDPEQGDIYEEYMWLNNAWEKVGSTKIDLSDYVKKSDLFMSLVNGIPSITFEEV